MTTRLKRYGRGGELVCSCGKTVEVYKGHRGLKIEPHSEFAVPSLADPPCPASGVYVHDFYAEIAAAATPLPGPTVAPRAPLPEEVQ